jgi:hypothetical protein
LRGLAGLMMITGAGNHQFGQPMAFEMERAEFGVVNAHDFGLNLDEVARAGTAWR